MANSYNFGYGTGVTTGTNVIVIDDTIYFNYDPSSTTLQGDWWAHQIGEIDDEPEKEEPDEPVERFYPLRHEDEILRIIMRQEVWEPPKDRRSRVPNTHSAFFLFEQKND